MDATAPLAPPLADAACLSAWLRLHGVDSGAFGTGEAKTIGHLLAELRAGESTLALAGGQLRRRVDGAAVIVLATTPEGRRVVLLEDHQQFADGRVRHRDLPNSVGEKLGPGEDPRAGAERALAEELSLGTVVGLRAAGLERSTVISTSFPGLLTENVIHRFVCELHPDDWRAEGFVEEQADKRSVFRWETILSESDARVVTARRSYWFAGTPSAEGELVAYCQACGAPSPWTARCVLGGQSGSCQAERASRVTVGL